MFEIEIILLTNNVVKPFQRFHKEKSLEFIEFNKLHVTKCLAEHGLGYLINIWEKNDSNSSNEKKLVKKIIFDVGGTNLTFLHNLSVMDLRIKNVDSIVLSHWHYDHVGGLYKVLEEIEEKIPIYTHYFAKFERFFRRSNDVKSSDLRGKSYEEIKPLLLDSKIVNQEPIDLALIENFGGDVKFTTQDIKILDSEKLKIWVSGEIPRVFADEDFTDYFSLQDNEILEEDKILDDRCIIIEFQDRIIVLNGCCHSGLKNTLKHIISHINKPISQIIGGFHMASSSEERLNSSIDYLRDIPKYKNELYLFPIHCTGDKFLKKLERKKISSVYGFDVSVGTVFKFFS
ncbi:MAG: MBL fold metallo-hydrolase [Promethearchaeota archaeon]|nr:MAG: MBL fold metallo-hydrolase [Candidatus Lokiarchaeota archaeon]